MSKRKSSERSLPPGVVENKVPPGVEDKWAGKSLGSSTTTLLMIGMALLSTTCLAIGDADIFGKK